VVNIDGNDRHVQTVKYVDEDHRMIQKLIPKEGFWSLYRLLL